jgi:superfamily I DNA and/or RNA helicase
VGLSLVNRGEAEAIVEIVKTLVDKGVEASDIGIIALCE